MENLIAVLLFVVIIGGLMLLFNVYTKFLAIFLAGIFYKSYMKIPEAAFNLYKQEMIKRNLPLE